MRVTFVIIMLIVSISSWGQRSAFFDLAKFAEKKEDYLEAVRLMKLSYGMDCIKEDHNEECLDELAAIIYYFSKLEQPDSVRLYAYKGWNLVENLSESSPEASVIYGQNIVISLYNTKCDSLALQYGRTLLPILNQVTDSDIIITDKDWRLYLSNIESHQNEYIPKSEFEQLDFELQGYLNNDDLRNAQQVVEKLTEWYLQPGRTYKELVSAWLTLGTYYMRIGDKLAAKLHVENAWVTIREEKREPTFEEIMYRINIEKEIAINPDWLIATTDSLLHSDAFANRWSKRFSEQALTDRAYLLEACGWGYDHKGEFQKAKDCITQSLEYERTINRLNKLGTLSLSLQDYTTATNCFEEIIDSLGLDNVREDVLSNLCASYWLSNNRQSLELILPAYLNLRKNKIIDCFGFMTADEREIFISSNPIGGWFETALATAFSSSGNQWNTGNKLAYNLALWRKGLLLESSRDFQRILNSLPPETQPTIRKYQSLHNQYINNSIAVDSIAILKDYERKLMKYIEQDSTYLSSLRDTWNNISKKLQNNAAAIEFVEVAIPNESDITHSKIGLGVLILTSNIDYPMYVFLGSNDDLSVLTPFDENCNQAFDILYEPSNAQQAYEIIWEPIEQYLSNVETVFYSPDGLVHSINLDYLQDSQGSYLCDKYNLRRVSSTRQIHCHENMLIANKNSTLVGNIAYAPNQNKGVNRTRASNRNGFEYLEGTVREVSSIDSLLNIAKYISTKLVMDDATEENFRNLSEHSPEIIHLATHGFYYSAEKASKENTYVGLFSNFSGMYRSGLAFKDAQLKWQNPGLLTYSSISDTDGILLSQELSSLDLSATKLAVLSACQTANGDSEYDGFIGLQRGFKLAGVESLLMSLWPVDDFATQKLMILFYKNFTNGYNMHDALHNAQKVIRETTGFEHVSNWAGWILLDALD